MVKDIITHFGVSQSTIYNILRDNDIELRTITKDKQLKALMDRICDLFDRGVMIKTIATQTNKDSAFIEKVLKIYRPKEYKEYKMKVKHLLRQRLADSYDKSVKRLSEQGTPTLTDSTMDAVVDDEGIHEDTLDELLETHVIKGHDAEVSSESFIRRDNKDTIYSDMTEEEILLVLDRYHENMEPFMPGAELVDVDYSDKFEQDTVRRDNVEYDIVYMLSGGYTEDEIIERLKVTAEDIYVVTGGVNEKAKLYRNHDDMLFQK